MTQFELKQLDINQLTLQSESKQLENILSLSTKSIKEK
jgi:hypothetical protein